MDVIERLFDANKRIAVAVSGGSDSMALLDMVSKRAGGRSFLAFTVNHHIRAEAAKDAAFVVDYCVKNGIAVRLYNVDALNGNKGESVESAARRLRRGVYQRVLQEYDYVLLAHHADDNAETVLFNLLRGTGLNGAKGMAATDGETRLVRPLLDTSRSALEEYREINGVPCVFDESNDDDAYARNHLRNCVFPALKRVNGACVKNINAFARRAREDNDALNSIASGLVRTENGCAYIDSEALSAALRPIAVRAVFLALAAVGLGCDAGESDINGVIGLTLSKNGGKKSVRGITVVKDYGRLAFFKGGERARTAETVAFALGGHCLCGKRIVASQVTEGDAASGLGAGSEALYFDLDRLPPSARIRTRRQGDRFAKFGAGSKSLSDYFINIKLSRRERDFVPLVACGEEVLIVCGFEISESVRITAQTARFCRIETNDEPEPTHK